MSRDLQQRLGALASAPTTALDGDRLDRIVERAMAVTEARPAHRRTARVLLAAAAAVVLVMFGVLAVGHRGSDTLRMTAADGVTVEFDDERVVGIAGLPLDDGAIVEIAPGGSADVGDRRYGPGRYVVVDGRLEPVGAASTTSLDADSTTTDRPRSAVGDADATRPAATRPDLTIAPTTIDRSSPTPTRPAGRPNTTTPARPTTTSVERRDVTDAPTTPTTITPTTITPATTTPTTTTDRTTTTTAPPDRTTIAIDRRSTTATTITTTTTTTPVTTTTTTTGPVRDRPPDDRP